MPTLDNRISVTRKPDGRSPVMFQRWEHLLFLHWTIDPEIIEKTLPPGLHVDTFDGKAYLGIVPFFMRGVRPRFCPVVPGLSDFLELNLRTYVHDQQGRPGVWFYSLDANQWLAVKIAQSFFSLPYIHARMEAAVRQNGTVDFQSKRKGTRQQQFQYRPEGAARHAEPGSLDYFLVERYLLFSYNPRRQSLQVGRVHHAPYPLHAPALEHFSTELFPLNGFESPTRPPDHQIMSRGVAVTIFALQKI